MSFEKLLISAREFGNESFVNDFEEAIANTSASSKVHTDRIKVLEGELEGSISKKNKLRDLIKSNTGLEELSEENFTGYINDLKSSGASEALKGDNERLMGIVSEYKGKLENSQSEYDNKISSMNVDISILESGELAGIKSSVAKGVILDKVRENAVSVDGSVNYVDANGSTVLKDDGTPLTIQDKIGELRSNSDYTSFFPDKRKRGGSKGVDSPESNHGFKDLSKLTRTEKAELMSSMSSSEYQDLVRLNLNKGK